MHSYFVEEDAGSYYGLTDGLVVAVGVCTVGVVLTAVVALVGSGQLVHFEVVLDAVDDFRAFRGLWSSLLLRNALHRI